MRTFLGTIAAVGAIFLIVAFYPGGGPKPKLTLNPGPGTLAGAPAQSFRLQRVDGPPDALANYRGKIVFLNLWATWCPPCRDEMPALERLYNKYRSRGLIVLGIDQGEDPQAVSGFLRAHHLTYPNLLDREQVYGSAYAGIGLPTTIIVGRDGRIVKGIDGAMSFDQMRAYLKPALDTK